MKLNIKKNTISLVVIKILSFRQKKTYLPLEPGNCLGLLNYNYTFIVFEKNKFHEITSGRRLLNTSKQNFDRNEDA